MSGTPSCASAVSVWQGLSVAPVMSCVPCAMCLFWASVRRATGKVSPQWLVSASWKAAVACVSSTYWSYPCLLATIMKATSQCALWARLSGVPVYFVGVSNQKCGCGTRCSMCNRGWFNNLWQGSAFHSGYTSIVHVGMSLYVPRMAHFIVL